jgi:hypothetical protein
MREHHIRAGVKTLKQRRMNMIGTVALIVAIAFFMLVPVVYSTTYWPCGDVCQYEASHPTSLPSYVSLSCAFADFGAGYSANGAYGIKQTSYELHCPPKVINSD